MAWPWSDHGSATWICVSDICLVYDHQISDARPDIENMVSSCPFRTQVTGRIFVNGQSLWHWFVHGCASWTGITGHSRIMVTRNAIEALTGNYEIKALTPVCLECSHGNFQRCVYCVHERNVYILTSVSLKFVFRGSIHITGSGNGFALKRQQAIIRTTDPSAKIKISICNPQRSMETITVIERLLLPCLPCLMNTWQC